MKKRIYAIALLLSFLVVLSHEMIAHHHHEDLALVFSVSYICDDNHKHDNSQRDNHQHKHDSQKEEESKEHNHSFPFHQHITATDDIYLERTTLLESNIKLTDVSLFVFANFLRKVFLKPPNPEGNIIQDPPFLIYSFSYLEDFALRGPPNVV